MTAEERKNAGVGGGGRKLGRRMERSCEDEELTCLAVEMGVLMGEEHGGGRLM